MEHLHLEKVSETQIKASAKDGSLEHTFDEDLISDFKKILLVQIPEEESIELGFGDTDEDLRDIANCYQPGVKFYAADLNQLA